MSVISVQLKPSKHCLAEANVSLKPGIILMGMRLQENKGGFFLQMPTRFSPDQNRYLEVYHPIDREVYYEILDAVVDKYLESELDEE